MKKMNEVKIKMIRDYPIKEKSPFTNKYLSKDKTLSVSVLPSRTNPRTRDITNTHQVEKEEIVGIITRHLQDNLTIALSGLNIFKFIYNNIEKKGKGYNLEFKMNFEECRESNGYVSTQSVWHGLAELLDKDIIARTKIPGTYFLNPNFFIPTNTISVIEHYKLT
jgi:hypothetical protein